MELEYNGRIIKVYTGRTKRRGRIIEFEKLMEANSVVILPIEREYVIIERQFRPALDKYIYELPAGHINRGEKAEEAVKREMKEETGLIPKKIKFMFESYPEPGLGAEKFYFFYATDFEKATRKLDKDEIIEVKRVKIMDLFKMIKKGELTDLKSIAALLFYKEYF